jgi:hypothetical protein
MRRLLPATLTFVLAASAAISAQTPGRGDSTRQRGVYEQGVDLAGKVSHGGKTLLADDDNEWIVSNASILKDFEGRYVSVKCRMDPSKQAIRILYIRGTPASHPPNLGDSAFRR